MNVRKSRVLEKLRGGKVANCMKLNLADPRIAEIAAIAGFDSVWVDREHVATDWSLVENVVRAAKGSNVDVMVRVSKGSYSDLIHPLELDAAGIIVPHAKSLSVAQQIVRDTKFHPLGRRPLDGGNADGGYTAVGLAEHLKQSNREKFVCIQIEDPEPLDELEQIAALEGIDMLFFGPGDFSQGIVAPGEWQHPEIQATRRRIAQVCLDSGKVAATVGSADNYAELVEMGYRYISIGADVVGLQEYFKRVRSIFTDML